MVGCTCLYNNSFQDRPRQLLRTWYNHQWRTHMRRRALAKRRARPDVRPGHEDPYSILKHKCLTHTLHARAHLSSLEKSLCEQAHVPKTWWGARVYSNTIAQEPVSLGLQTLQASLEKHCKHLYARYCFMSGSEMSFYKSEQVNASS